MATTAPDAPATTGAQLRNRALAKHEEDSRKAEFYSRARAAVLEQLAKAPATLEQCLADAGVKRPEWLHPNCMGGISARLSMEGLIRRKGYRQARQPKRHCGVVVLWELA